MTSSYNNDPSLKIDLIQEMEAHIEADRLVKGTYGRDDNLLEDFRGCSVACSIFSLNKLTGKKIRVNDHNGLAEAIGLPECGWLTRLQDYFFENLPEPDHQQWSLDFLEAIPVGVSEEKIQLVKWRFLEGVLTDVLSLPELPDDVQSVVTQVRDLCARAGAEDMPDDDEWYDAKADARATYYASRAAYYASRAVYDDYATYATVRAADDAYAAACAADAADDALRKWASLLLNLLRKAGE